VGYGDSYILDPFGETVVRSRRGKEDFIFADVDPTWPEALDKWSRSRQSARLFGQLLLDAAKEK
jgi:predicted amidohydrolase